VPAISRMSSVPDIRIHSDSQAVAEAAAAFVLEVGQEAIRTKGRFFIARSGGTTPETLYRALTSPAFADRFDWSRTTFFSAMNVASPRMTLEVTMLWPTRPCSPL
jgi:Glucosamine-6-phosphate isomerases/6-phosphogluconolactonase